MAAIEQRGFRALLLVRAFRGTSVGCLLAPRTHVELPKCPTEVTEVSTVRNCTLCKYSKICNDLPGVCVLIPYVAVALVTMAVAYLFVTQELL